MCRKFKTNLLFLYQFFTIRKYHQFDQINQGVNLGPDATARQNGSVGGEITRRLVSMAQSNMAGK